MVCLSSEIPRFRHSSIEKFLGAGLPSHQGVVRIQEWFSWPAQTQWPPAVESSIAVDWRANPAFSKPCLFLSDIRHFRHFRRFRGSEERNPCFQWVECKFVIFAVFVKTAPFWQGTKTRFTKNTVCATPWTFQISVSIGNFNPCVSIRRALLANREGQGARQRVAL